MIYYRNLQRKRSCLMCGKMFDSKSPGNRRCPRCASSLMRSFTNIVNTDYIYKMPPRVSKAVYSFSE